MLSQRTIGIAIFLSNIVVLTALISFFIVHYMIVQHENLKFWSDIRATNYTKIRSMFGINNANNELQVLLIKQYHYYNNQTYRSLLIRTQHSDMCGDPDVINRSSAYLSIFEDNDRKNTLVYNQAIPLRTKYFSKMESIYLWKIWPFLDVARVYMIYNKVYEILGSDEQVNYSLLYISTENKSVRLHHFKNDHKSLQKETVKFELDAYKIVLWILGNYRWYF